MVKAILAEEFLQNYISSVCEISLPCNLGLIAGHKSSQRDYVVALLPTPAEDDEDEGDGELMESKASAKQRGIEKVNEQWIAEHARQVMRMLPGGLSVMGIYVAASDEELNKSQSKLRQILFAIYKLFQKKHLSPLTGAESLDWSILQISTKTKKLTCKTFNVADPKSTAKPADWKFQSFVNSWSCVSCRLQVNLRIPFQKRFRDCSHYSKFVLNGTDNLLNAVSESMVLINGQLRDETEAIESLLGKKKSGKKSSSGGSSQPLEIKAELLMDKAVQGPTQDLEYMIAGDTKIIGWVHARGYLSPKSTFGDVEKVIKEDIERSLRVRFDLLGEELRQSSGDAEVKELETDPPSIIATPQRVLAKLPGTPICVSDYIFQDEQPQDVGAHFLELLNITVTEEDVDFNCEQMPDDSLLQQIETASSHSSEAANLDELLNKPGGGGELLRYA
ncbi:hypothetical protein BSL78_17469, partial [Apostichopus japonicus]